MFELSERTFLFEDMEDEGGGEDGDGNGVPISVLLLSLLVVVGS